MMKKLSCKEKILLHQKKRKYQKLLLAACLGILLLAAVFFLIKKPRKATDAPQKPDAVQPSSEAESNPAAILRLPDAEITVSLMGDCTLGTDQNFNYATSFNAYYDTQGADYFFANVKSILEADDLSIVNMEGTLTESTARNGNKFAFKGAPEYARVLSGSSVEAANLANNHSHDYGDQSFEDTKNILKDAGITTFGYDDTAVMTVKGIKIGLVGIYELNDHLERMQQLKDNIAKVKKDGADLIITIFHWGNERETVPDSNQRTLAHTAVDYGSDLVIGHHPHVLQGIEEYHGKYIVYSLGNFCFGGNSAPSDMDTMIFQQTFTIRNGEVLSDENINIIPCCISSVSGYNNYQPTPAEGSEAERILQKLEDLSSQVPSDS